MIRLSISTFLVFLIFSATVRAQQSNESFIACSLPLPPHTMPDEKGVPSGYATEVLQAVTQQLNWKIEIRYMPWLRVVDQAKNGHCDVVYTVLKRSDYEDFLLYPKHAVQQRRNVLAVLRGKGIKYDGNLEKFMRQHTLGLYRDKAVSSEYERLKSADWVRIDFADDAQQNIRKLLLGRFDAAIDNDWTLAYELGKLGRLDDVELLQPPLDVTQAYIAFPKAGRLAARVIEFDQALLKYQKTREHAALGKTYRYQHP